MQADGKAARQAVHTVARGVYKGRKLPNERTLMKRGADKHLAAAEVITGTNTRMWRTGVALAYGDIERRLLFGAISIISWPTVKSEV